MDFKKSFFIAAAFLFGCMQPIASAAPELQSLNVLGLPEWEVTSSSYGGKLLLSDSPEMVSADGIMYQDTVEGSARLFFHHVNDTKSRKRIMVVLESPSKTDTVVTVTKYGLGGPDKNWVAVGKNAQRAYLGSGGLYLVEVPGDGFAFLSPELSKAVVEPGALVNGIYDFFADHPVTVKVMMLPENADVGRFSRRAKVLPADSYRLRGTFEGANRLLIPLKIYDPAEAGPVAITLADNKLDKYVTGIDATDGSAVLNYGNYGVVYNLFLPAKESGKIGYYLNPRGGDYAGAIGVKYRHLNQPPVDTPAGRLAFGNPTDFAAVGKFDGNESLWLTFSPPGASNLPVKLIIMPQ